VLATACAPKSKSVASAAETAPADWESANWKPAESCDESRRGNWWPIVDDGGLDELEAQIAVSNQNLKEAEARFARAPAPDSSGA
jgi:outer membrane protein TolC